VLIYLNLIYHQIISIHILGSIPYFAILKINHELLNEMYPTYSDTYLLSYLKYSLYPLLDYFLFFTLLFIDIPIEKI
jgi:hypothetical protein